jgi:hypothetical protein
VAGWLAGWLGTQQQAQRRVPRGRRLSLSLNFFFFHFTILLFIFLNLVSLTSLPVVGLFALAKY